MRRTWLAAALTACVLLTVAAAGIPAAAHPPEEMTIIYNDRLEILTVSISHDVKDRTTHYVERIEVYRNDALIIERSFDSQPRDSFNERFQIENMDVGEKIRVVACCNLEGCIEREMELGKGITAEGDKAGTIGTAVVVHAIVQVAAFAMAIAAMPGGMGFYKAWKTRTKPKGRRRLHIRMGMAAIYLWGIGALGGLWLVYMTSGDYLGSQHGWLAIATFASALFAGYSGSPNFRKAGYGMRMSTHMPLSMLTIVMGVVTMLTGALTAGFI